MKNIILIILLFICLLLPSVSAKVELIINHETIIIGDTIRVEKEILFPKIFIFKPLFPVPPSATNIQVISSENKTIFYEKYTKDDYIGLQEYLKKACSISEEGYIPYDGGFVITQNNVSIETRGGYCQDYQKMIPDEKEDIILINHSGISLPLTYFLISYELRRDTTTNAICDFDQINIRYVLPEGAYIWNSTVPLKEEFTENRIMVFINYSLIKDKGVCFSYGTESEWHMYDDKKDNLFYFYVGISITIVSIFIALIFLFYSRNNPSHLIIHLILLSSLFVIWLIFLKPIKLYYKFVPPFSLYYTSLINKALLGVIILYLVSLIPLKLIYVRCSKCNKVIKRSGYNQHKNKVHNI